MVILLLKASCKEPQKERHPEVLMATHPCYYKFDIFRSLWCLKKYKAIKRVCGRISIAKLAYDVIISADISACAGSVILTPTH